MPDLSKFKNLTQIYIYGEKARDCSTISNVESLVELTLNSVNLTGNMPNISKLKNLKTLSLQGNYLNNEDIKKILDLKENTNLTIDLRNNSIIDATVLLELNPNTKIYLSGNVNLSQDSKDKLKARFGNNVTF